MVKAVVVTAQAVFLSHAPAHPTWRSLNVTHSILHLMDKYKTVSYYMHKLVKEVKQCYGRKPELQVQQGDSRSLWQGMRMLVDYKTPFCS